MVNQNVANGVFAYPENQKPRKAEAQYDFLFRPATGALEWYDPAQHGQWEIAELEDGKLVAREITKEPDLVDPVEPGKSFAAEHHVRDFLAKNLHVIEDGLQIYVDEGGTVGVEYKTPMGRMDLLTVDKKGGLLIVELKVERDRWLRNGATLRWRWRRWIPDWRNFQRSGGMSPSTPVVAAETSEMTPAVELIREETGVVEISAAATRFIRFEIAARLRLQVWVSPLLQSREPL